jgi:hypothetical protein
LEAVGHCADCIIEATPQPVLGSITPLTENNTLLQRIEHLSCLVTALRVERAGFHFLGILTQKFIEIN